MEEQKKTKEVKMNTAVGGAKDNSDKKYSYDDLNDICNKLFQENRYLKYQLQQAQNALSTIDRLNYLFKVLELSKTEGYWKFDVDFINSCVGEVENALTIPVQEEKEPNAN